MHDLYQAAQNDRSPGQSNTDCETLYTHLAKHILRKCQHILLITNNNSWSRARPVIISHHVSKHNAYLPDKLLTK